MKLNDSDRGTSGALPMTSPLVSICTPTYNRPEYLRRVVQSCLAQTYPNFELIITDNSTNSESKEAMARIQDPRVRYYSNNGNIGSLASCNRGLGMAQGKYITLLMDDDLIKPKFMESMVAAFETNPTAGIVMAPMDLIDEDDRRIFPKFYIFRTMRYRYRYQVGDGLIERKRLLRDFLTRDYPCTVPSGIMYRGDALRPILPVVKEADFAGDLDLCMTIAAKWDFYYLDEVLSSWRYTPANHTATTHKAGLNVSAFYYITRKCLGQPEVREMFRDEWSSFERNSFYFCTCRAALLNGMAGLRGASPTLVWQTFKSIWRDDPHHLNLLRVPFFAAREMWTSFFPPQLPPARGG